MEKRLPEGWEIKQFLECIEKEASSNKLKIPKSEFQNKGEYPIIDQGIEYIAGYTDNPLKVYKSELPVIIFGDHTRIFKFVDFPFSLGADGTKVLVPKKDLLYPKYFYFFLHRLKIESHGYSRHYKFLKEKQIVIPPLQTQKKIVSILEKADEIKRLRMQADELTSQLLQSVFLEMFGDPVTNPKMWDVVKLEEICDNERKVTYGIVQPGKEVESGIPIVRSVNLIENSISLEGLKKIDPQIEASYPRSRLRGGELLVSVRGTVCPVAIASIELENANMSRGVAIVAPNSRCMVEYLLILFKTSAIQHWISVISKGIALKQLNLVELRKLKIPLPPLDIQQKFAQIVEKVEVIRQNQKQSQQALDNLFDALTQKAFKGELIA